MVQERTVIDPISDYAEIIDEMEDALNDPNRQREERGIEAQKGMRMGQKAVGRTKAWRTDDGREVWLPTDQLQYHLAKRRPNGDRVFVLSQPAVAQRVPLDISCPICIRVNGVSRKFYSEGQYQDHMEILHPREHERDQREIERQERKEEREVLRALATGRSESGASQKDSDQSLTCGDCGKTFGSDAALRGHQQVHSSKVS